MTRIDKKVAIVTGASSGMGLALTKNLAADGWVVAMTDISPNAELEAEVADTGSFFVKSDVSSHSSQAALFAEVWKKTGRIDALCANAGIVDKSSIYTFGTRPSQEELDAGTADPTANVPPEPSTVCTDVDYKGVVYGTHLATHYMRFNSPPGGKIVVTASVAAVHPHETYPEYDGAKAAVVGFARAVSRVLWYNEKITINCVLPGIVQTNIIPPEMVAAVQPQFMTPVSTIIAGYRHFLDEDDAAAAAAAAEAPAKDGVDPTDRTTVEGGSTIPGIKTGVALEGSVEGLFPVKFPSFSNGQATRRAVTVWDPLFKMYHGVPSNLPDAIP